jgi:ribonuclease HI
MAFQLQIKCTRNKAEYKALIFGLEILIYIGVTTVQILGDSQLVIKQITRSFKCINTFQKKHFLRRYDNMFRKYTFQAKER